MNKLNCIYKEIEKLQSLTNKLTERSIRYGLFITSDDERRVESNLILAEKERLQKKLDEFNKYI